MEIILGRDNVHLTEARIEEGAIDLRQTNFHTDEVNKITLTSSELAYLVEQLVKATEDYPEVRRREDEVIAKAEEGLEKARQQAREDAEVEAIRKEAQLEQKRKN